VNAAEVTELSASPTKATAFIVVVAVIVNAPLYFVEEAVGSAPSVV
jgi:hypothetical protein